MFDIAAEYGALLLFVEHRYYGSSFPFGSAEAAYANTSTLDYLSSEQAIADYVQFIDWFKKDPGTLCQGRCQGVRVIGFGGSYGGMLAAWMRIKYPFAIDGAIAASAPIWQFVGMVAPTVYSSIITRDYTLATPHCAKGISRVWSIIDAMAGSKEGLRALTDVFRPCNTSVFTPETVGSIYGFLSEAFGYMAMAESPSTHTHRSTAARQHTQALSAHTFRSPFSLLLRCLSDACSYPYEASFLGPMPAYPVSYACKAHFTDVDPSTADNATVLAAVYGVASVFWNYTGQAGQCNDLNAQGPSTLGSQDGWGFQCCTEMIQAIGQYGGDNDMFWRSPFDLDDYIRGCQRPMSRGGWGTTPRVGWIDEEYGGLHMEAASRIFFSSGSLDPWSGLTPNATAFDGAYSPSNPRGVVCYYMNGTAHHLDLRGRNDTFDPPEVVRVRNLERLYISSWLEGHDRPRDEDVALVEAGVDPRHARVHGNSQQRHPSSAPLSE